MEKIIEDLTQIRGIGRRTAEIASLRGLHRPDAFPWTMWAYAGSSHGTTSGAGRYPPRRHAPSPDGGATGRDLLRTILKSQTCPGSVPEYSGRFLPFLIPAGSPTMRACTASRPGYRWHRRGTYLRSASYPLSGVHDTGS